MASIVAMRAFLRDVIVLADSGAPDNDTRRDAVSDEGLSMMSGFSEFGDKGIKILCASRVVNPGHSIPTI